MSSARPFSGTNSPSGLAWHWSVRLLHWLTVLSVLGAAALALARDWVDDDDLTDALLNWHRQAGMLVMALTVLRLLTRLSTVAPDHGMTPMQQRMASGAHLLLYALLLGMPILGWLTSNAHGAALTIGPITLPTLIPRDHDLGDTLGEWHEWGAWLFLGLIGLHAAAALWHHWVQRDQVLTAMTRGTPRSRS